MHLGWVGQASCPPKTHLSLSMASQSSVLIARSARPMSKSLFSKTTYF